MSGIVAIINTDGAPVDRQLLRRLTDFMAFRGPDAQDIWLDGHIGFGHTMLRTTFESANEQQPCTLDGQVWITADARIDGRAELIQKLTGKGRHVLASTPDVELILHAWHVWGEACLEHLLGDFAFAIWDKHEQQLFCARDHFGIKPFFYSQVGNHLLISNTLNCLRLHPAVSDELNDHFIGDFLLTGFYVNPEISAFADIQRLPAAHSLKWKAGTLTIRRYWTLPINDPVYYKRSEEYVEHFDELLTAAVSDRLRTNSVAVFMSGGIDSPAVAATANKILKQNGTAFDLQAYTIVYDRLILDEERYYAGLVAKHLNIPINYQVADDYQLYERWNDPKTDKPEPVHFPLAAIGSDRYKQVASNHRIVLTGEGGDVILRPSFSYLTDLLRRGQIKQSFVEVVKHTWQNRRLPRIGFRTRIKQRYGKKVFLSGYPCWINPDFEKRLKLLKKWDEQNSEFNPEVAHPHRPEAYQLLTSAYWSFLFGSYDAGTTSFTAEARHPLFDLRLLSYSLRLPSLPWCVDKRLLRTIMHDKLPPKVLGRQKTPLSASPTLKLLKGDGFNWSDHFRSERKLDEYINLPQYQSRIETYFKAKHMNSIQHEMPASEIWSLLRPVTLNYWLKMSQSFNHPLTKEPL